MRVHPTLTTSLAVFLLACNDGGTPFGDQSGTSGRVKPEELLGALKAPLGSNWGDFDRALATVTPWTGGHRQKRCSDMFLCGLLLSKGVVEIQANPESMFANSTNVGTHGTILMKLVNTGKRPTGKYGLNPSSEYYVVVKHAPPSAWQWAFVEKAGSAPPQVGDWHGFNECKPNHEPKKSTARFQTCDDPEPLELHKSSMLGLTKIWSSAAKAIQLAFELEPPGWISCAYGCCTLAY